MILNLLISFAMASPWLVKAPSADLDDFIAYAQNSSLPRVSQALTSCPQAATARDLLKEGQFHFLSGSLDEAKIKFSGIADLKWECDWKEDERQIIVFAFLRLAQMTADQSARLSFLTDAVSFDSQTKPDLSIFPPPIVDMYLKVGRELSQKQFLFPPGVKKYSRVLRNGRPLNLDQLGFETTPIVPKRESKVS